MLRGMLLGDYSNMLRNMCFTMHGT